MTPTEQPIAPHEPMPHRKVIREWLVPLSEQTTVKALVLLVILGAVAFLEAMAATTILLACLVLMGALSSWGLSLRR